MNDESRNSNRPFSDRKSNDRSLVLLIVGCLLLTPPLAGIFQLDFRILGIPFTGFYLFAVWGALIVGAALLSRQQLNNSVWVNQEDAAAEEDVDNSA
ncbi:MAG: hypothetical protein LJE92_11585 [Gammaproteobacteria bacterium]|jgi:hypothetical membrane protein|nr:hypothetical protein [Gammaproteobacteria bacterium]